MRLACGGGGQSALVTGFLHALDPQQAPRSAHSANLSGAFKRLLRMVADRRKCQLSIHRSAHGMRPHDILIHVEPWTGEDSRHLAASRLLAA